MLSLSLPVQWLLQFFQVTELGQGLQDAPFLHEQQLLHLLSAHWYLKTDFLDEFLLKL